MVRCTLSFRFAPPFRLIGSNCPPSRLPLALLISVRCSAVLSTCQIRVGGGWQELKQYVDTHGGVTQADEEHPAQLELAGSAFDAKTMDRGDFEASMKARTTRHCAGCGKTHARESGKCPSCGLETVSTTDGFVDSILENWGNEQKIGRLCRGVGLNSRRTLKVGARVGFKLDLYCTDCNRERGRAGGLCPECNRANKLRTSPIGTLRDVGISFKGRLYSSVEPDDALGTRTMVLPSMLLPHAGVGAGGSAPGVPTLLGDGPAMSPKSPPKSPVKSPMRRNSRVSPLHGSPSTQPAVFFDFADRPAKTPKKRKSSSKVAPIPPGALPSFSTFDWAADKGDPVDPALFDAEHKTQWSRGGCSRLVTARESITTQSTFTKVLHSAMPETTIRAPVPTTSPIFGVDTMWHCTRCDRDRLKTPCGCTRCDNARPKTSGKDAVPGIPDLSHDEDNGKKCPHCGVDSIQKNMALPLISRDPFSRGIIAEHTT